MGHHIRQPVIARSKHLTDISPNHPDRRPNPRTLAEHANCPAVRAGTITKIVGNVFALLRFIHNPLGRAIHCLARWICVISGISFDILVKIFLATIVPNRISRQPSSKVACVVGRCVAGDEGNRQEGDDWCERGLEFHRILGSGRDGLRRSSWSSDSDEKRCQLRPADGRWNSSGRGRRVVQERESGEDTRPRGESAWTT
jgi:hypothetical protein